MKKYYILLSFYCILGSCCFSQKWDINVKIRFDSLGKYNYINNYLLNNNEYDNTKRNSSFLELSFSNYLNNKNHYKRLLIGINSALYHGKTKSLITNELIGITQNYRNIRSYYIGIEHGLYFQWDKFTALLGAGLSYDYRAKYHAYKLQESYIANNIANTYNGVKVEQNYLPSHAVGLYNGNSLYYTFCKGFYVGLDIRNSLKYRFSNNLGKSITYILDESGNVTQESYSNITTNEKRIYASFLDTFFSLGFKW